MPAPRLAGPIAFLAIAIGSFSMAHGQAEPNSKNLESAGEGESSSSSGIRFSLDVNSRFGSDTFVPDQWGELHFHLENSSSTERDVLCTSYFAPDSTLQFGRQVWLPARSRLSLSHPVLAPDAGRLVNQTASIHSLLIERSQGSEILIKSDSGQLRHERSLLLTPMGRHTGIVAGWNTSDLVPQDVLDLVIADRVNQGLDNRTTILGGEFLPADEQSLKYLDHLVLAESRVADDYSGLTAVRRWLHAGGRLWVMLDRTDPIVLERLLGDEFQGIVVDRVGLTTVRIDGAPTLASAEGEVGEAFDYEEPVALAQVVVSGMKVWNTVNGWPAAMTASFGEGRVLVTTLGARGWVRPAAPVAEKTASHPPGRDSAFVPSSPMEDLAAYVLSPREAEPLSRKALETFTEEFVSYRVPSWTTIAGIMGGLFASLLVAGLWLRRARRVEHFGWVGSLLAVSFGTVLFGIGLFHRYRVPATLASVQFAQAIPGTDDVRTQEAVAVYRPEANDSSINTSQGGELWPDMSGSEGTTRRLITTDLGAFHWSGLSNSPGLHLHAARTSRSAGNRIEAEATLNGEGIVGKCSGVPASGADSLLVTCLGRMSLKLNADGGFTARPEDVLGADQFLGTNFVSDEQDRRRRILQELYRQPQWKDSLTIPQLLVWADDWDPGFQFGEGLARRGDTLLAVPLRLIRPAPGIEIVVPSPLLSYATARSPDGLAPSGFWDDLKGEWQERTSPGTTWLAFRIPRDLLPLKATRGQLNVNVTGPIGRVEILGVKDGRVAKLETVASPVGTVVIALTDAEALNISEAGELILGVSGGDPAQPATISTTASGATAGAAPIVNSAASSHWKVESLSLQLWAKTVERSDED